MITTPKFGGRIRQPVHYFHRFVGKTTISYDGTSPTYGSLYFQLADVPGYSEFITMYDFFKIVAVKVMFVPYMNVTYYDATAGVSINNSNYSNRFFSVIDYNDSTTPTSLDDLRQYSNCKMTPRTRTHKRFFYPKPVMVVDKDSSSGSTVGYAEVIKNPWISTESLDTRYYGIKYGFEQTNPSNSTNEAYRVECVYYMKFKGRN